MYAIETDVGRFEGETEREAKRLERSARRAAGKQEKTDQANRETARIRAQTAGFRVLSQIVAGGDCPTGWVFYSTRHRFGPKLERGDNGYSTTCILDTQWGTGKWTYVDGSHSVVGAAWTSGGFHQVLFVDNGDGPDAYSIGVCEDQIVLERMCGVKVEWFRQA